MGITHDHNYSDYSIHGWSKIWSRGNVIHSIRSPKHPVELDGTGRDVCLTVTSQTSRHMWKREAQTSEFDLSFCRLLFPPDMPDQSTNYVCLLEP